MLTALIVDADPQARRRMGALLRLGGWRTAEAATATEALLQAAGAELDLVVTEVLLPRGNGFDLLRQLRHRGSRARFLMITADPTERIRAHAAAAGAVACLAKPVDARHLLDFLRRRTTGPAAPEPRTDIREVGDLHDADIDADLMARLQETYMTALPDRLSAIARGARSGNPAALASAANTLAGTSGQLGHPDVAEVCRAIAQDARRGILAHGPLARLHELASGGERRRVVRGPYTGVERRRHRQTPYQGVERRRRPQLLPAGADRRR